MKEIDAQIPQISRRNFLKGTAALAAATAFSGSFPIELLAAERVYAPGEVVRRGSRTEKRIFLTFDDCFNARIVGQVADIADREGVKITYFPIGEQVARNKSLYGGLIRRGHDVENHTWNHGNLKNKTRDQVVQELLRQRDVVRQAAQAVGITDYQQIFMRPPGGAGRTDPEVISVTRQYDYIIAMWSSDPQGWRKSVTTDMIIQRAISDFSNGMILLQHTRPKDLEALPRIIRAARRSGYTMDKTLREGIKTSIYP